MKHIKSYNEHVNESISGIIGFGILTLLGIRLLVKFLNKKLDKKIDKLKSELEYSPEEKIERGVKSKDSLQTIISLVDKARSKYTKVVKTDYGFSINVLIPKTKENRKLLKSTIDINIKVNEKDLTLEIVESGIILSLTQGEYTDLFDKTYWYRQL